MKVSEIISIYETSYSLKKHWFSILHTNYFIVYSVYYLGFSEMLFYFPPCKLKPPH